MKYLKYSLVTIFSALALLIVLVAAIVLFRGDAIKQGIIDAVNQKVNTPILVKGGIQVEFWTHFPNITVRFNEIEIKESVDFTDRNVLEAESLEFVLNIWNLIRSKYNVNEIVFENGKILLEVFKDGSTNFNILKTDDGTEESVSSDNIFEIRSAVFRSIDFFYRDHKSAFTASLNINNGRLSASFNPEFFVANTDFELLIHRLETGKNEVLKNKEIRFAGDIAMDFLNNTYALESLKASIENFHFDLSGNLINQTQPELDFYFSTAKSNFNDVLQLFPSLKKNVPGKINGDFSISGSVKGSFSENGIPLVQADFYVLNGSIDDFSELEGLSNIELDGSISSGTSADLSNLVLYLRKFGFTYNQAWFNGDLRLESFTDPYIQTSLNGVFPLTMLHLFISNEYLQINGNGKLEEVKLSLYPKRMLENKSGTIQQFSGKLSVQKADLNREGKRIQIPSANISFNNQKFEIIHLSVSDKMQEWTAKGELMHLFEYIGGMMNESTPSQIPELNLSIKGNRLDLPKLIGFFEIEDDQASAERYSAQTDLFKFSSFKGKLEIHFNDIHYDRIHTQNVNGNFTFNPGKFDLNRFSFNSAKGRFNGSGTIHLRQGNNIDIEGRFHAENVQIDRLFNDCQNFGQDFITHEALSGRLNADVVIGNYWRNGNYDLDRLSVIADIQIEEGRLYNFEPMQALSSYIQADELRDIRFSRLHNRVEIGNSRVFLPGMQIVSNAFVIHLEGIHSFENEIDYNIRVNLSHMLASRHRNRNRSQDYWEENPDGSINLFLSMKGHADNPNISYNTAAVRQQVRRSFQSQSEEVRRAFSGNLDDYDRGRETQDWQTEDEIEFIDWD